MTEQEKTIVLAIELMGWRKWDEKNLEDDKDWSRNSSWLGMNGKHVAYSEDSMGNKAWNPYENENHGRQVIEKLMEDDELFYAMMNKLERDLGFMAYMKSTLPERMDAVVSVLDSQKA